MSKYIGRLVNLGIAKETVRGTAVAPTYWLAKAVVSFFDRAIRYKSRLSYGSIGDGGAQAPKIMEWAEGSIEGDVMDTPFGLFLLAAFGTVTPAGPTDSAYTHTFTLQNDNQHDSLSLTLADPDRTDRYSLQMLDSLEIKVVPDDVITFVAGFKGRTGRQQAAATATYAQYNKFLGRHASIKIAATAADLAAATAISVKSLTLRIKKNLVFDNNLGTVWPDDILNTKLEIEGDLELYLNDQTYRQYMLDASYKALRINFTNNDAVIGAGTTRPSFTLDLSRVAFEGWEAARPNDEVVSQKITFRALWDVTNGNIINSCTLVNGVTAY